MQGKKRQNINLGGSCAHILYRSRPNLARNSRPTVYAYMPYFIWMCLLCRLLGSRNRNFGQILTFGGLLYSAPFTDEGQIWYAKVDPDQRSMLTRQILSSLVYSDLLVWRKTPNFAIFRLQHFVASPIGGVWRKLNVNAQPQTFPYPKVSKSFLCSNNFMAKSCT